MNSSIKRMIISVLGGICAFFSLFLGPSYQSAEGIGGTLIIVVGLIAWFCAFYCYVYLSNVYSGTVWGAKIKCPPQIKNRLFLFTVLFGVFFLFAIFQLVFLIKSLFGGLGFMAVILAALDIACMIVGFSVAGRTSVKLVTHQTHALCLGSLDIFKEVDANLGQAVRFVVGFEGVALFSGTNYCYAVYRYEDYQLGELTIPEEVALVGMYFVQKYHDRFKFKVDMEIIPGEPGQTAVAFGAGGIAVAHTKGTKTQALFRSYIFTKK